jgi:shikimate 5-dehydrogenase
MMNNNDEIKLDTKVYGFLGEYAQQNRFSVMMNAMFKRIHSNAMIIPMNIRADDFYYTVTGLRQAKLNGAVIAQEYRHDVVELCDFKSNDVSMCGFCDILRVVDGKLYGDILIGRAINMLLKEKGATSLALYGSGALAKSILLHVKHSGIKKVTLFNDRIESCMELIETLGEALLGIDVDIERASNDLAADFSASNIAINTANQMSLFSAVHSSPVMVDFAMQRSPFSDSAADEYLGYDAILPYLNQSAYNIFEGNL